MVLIFSKRDLLKHRKVGSMFILLLIIVFYVLPQLLNLYWDLHQQGPRPEQEPLLEKPLRVQIFDTLENCLIVDEKIPAIAYISTGKERKKTSYVECSKVI